MANNLETATEYSTSFNMVLNGELVLSNLPPVMEKKITAKLQIKNPTYEQAIRTNPRARFTLSPYIKYWRKDKRTGALHIGRGCEASVRAYAERCKIGIKCTNELVSRRSSSPISTTIRLRPYQEGVVSAADSADSGIFRLDTGAGKTVLAIELSAKLGRRTLFIVPKLDLLNQFINEIRRFTDTGPGVIQGKNVDIKDFTVATVQSLRNRIKDGSIAADTFGCVIVDEAHLFVPKKSRAVVNYFKSKYLYGFTATARRTDQQGEALEWIFGAKLVDIKLPGMNPKVRVIPFTGKIWMGEYSTMVDEQIADEDRNNLIVSTIETEVAKGHRVIVLTKRVDHAELIAENLTCSKVIEFRSDMKKDQRDSILANLKSEAADFNVICGTTGLLSTGIDVPSLDCVVFAGDMKSDVLVEQGAGRIRRLFSGKKDPIVLDIYDTGNGIFKNQGRLRQQFYKEQGWEIL